jgi:hypothetical protein
MRIDVLLVLFRVLLAAGAIDLAGDVFLPAVFEHEMRRHRTGIGAIGQRQHNAFLPIVSCQA